ncbi:MAG: chemotaxis-specific protein-glutamate methyltransferase CheB [Candidatus Loosdrechtia sp.]|uniref:chemotaxis-specific protein-glutamate methyltransferase CheB n=1 Tax=Candidatus Loosdrechtia sp. TaxID=3101272 RepID=UPI003A6552CF|nr:MAG: chemotaxis-specific protein-glutamate methyltransferase CheB [Candidatus Jettenia sp. AMX2]
MIKVLVVEDSPAMCEFMVHILGSDSGIQVIGAVSNGEEAVEVIHRIKPDVITMDINMPKMNGFEATRRIMETFPVPIVIVSATWDTKEISTTFLALEAGAVAVLEKPRGIGHPEYESMAKNLIQTVKLMSEVKVVRRWAGGVHRKKAVTRGPVSGKITEEGRRIVEEEIRLVAMGASTGGPLVLKSILSGLPKDFSIPVVIVQHMAAGFIQGFADWLGRKSVLPVGIAIDGSYLLPGRIYIAPDSFQMRIEKDGKVALTKDAPENGLRPSVSYLFRSVAESFGKHAVGILLTGMGKDGAEELKLMKEKGAITIAQDKESSVIHGMPGEAIKLNAATYVSTPEKIIEILINLLNDWRVP